MHEVINVNVVYHNEQFAMDNCQIFLINMYIYMCIYIYIYKVESVNFA